MNVGSLIFSVLILGGTLRMFSMHRGGHAHKGAGSGGGCCGGGGHDHGGSQEEEQTPSASGERETKPLLGPPGTESSEHALVPAPEQQSHRGC